MNSQQLFFILISILGYGVGSFIYKIAGSCNMHPLMITTVVTCMYIIVMPIIFFFFKFDRSVTTAGITFSVVGGLAMGLGNLGYMFALKNGSAGEITAVTSLYPALTWVLSVLFLGEILTLKKAIGILLACASFIVLSLK